MPKVEFLSIMIVSVLISACSAKLNKDDDKVKEQGDGWPAYSEQPLSGNVLGQSWTVKTAVARLVGVNNDQISVDLYSENVLNACTNMVLPSKPYASIILPKNYSLTEYRADLLSRSSEVKNPLVFSSQGVVSKNVVATRTKLRITDITENGFAALVYANSDLFEGHISEINGGVYVADCTKVAAYSVWNDLKGNYQLYSYDGAPQDLRSLSIKEDVQNKFYDNTTESYLNAMVFPLLYSVSPNSELSYSFGPIEGLGLSKVSSTAISKTYKYSYNGPLNYGNTDITLILDLTATLENSYLYVTYTIEIPGHAAKTSHQFTLRKQ